ncbi:MAG: citrate synthase [Clostridia bacterium]|nr:citrate synthase [Clostridia bacterium]
MSTYASMLNQLKTNNSISPSLFQEHNVKSGLRNSDGTGVLVGLTKIGSVEGYLRTDEGIKPSEGRLLYRGIEITDIVKRYENRTGFEETAYLLLFGNFPNEDELKVFNRLIDDARTLPKDFTENMILKNPSSSIMNKIQRSILVLYSYDENPEDMTLDNQLKQCIRLIGALPTILAYGYHAKSHYFDQKSLYIHMPIGQKSTAANILHMLRPDNSYTPLEEQVLDMLLLLHAEHGGGNNSTFTTAVVTTTGTDTYSALAAAVGSLKGPKHGGANELVGQMIDYILERIHDQSDKEIKNILIQILETGGFDQRGLIYGLGHAVYTLTDPRAEILKVKAKALAYEKNRMALYDLYEKIETIGKEILILKKNKPIATNTDFYANLVYRLLEIPEDLYTPLFATGRMVGWCAHRIETMLSNPKILRPAYQYVK